MSNKATLGFLARWGLAGLALVAPVLAQTPSQSLDWRRVGNAAIDLDLAGLATGPVERVWFSPAGDRLWVRSSSGKTFVNNDLEGWSVAEATPAPVAEGRSTNLPEAGAQVRNPSRPSPRV